jgi:hypothetical protein
MSLITIQCMVLLLSTKQGMQLTLHRARQIGRRSKEEVFIGRHCIGLLYIYVRVIGTHCVRI